MWIQVPIEITKPSCIGLDREKDSRSKNAINAVEAAIEVQGRMSGIGEIGSP